MSDRNRRPASGRQPAHPTGGKGSASAAGASGGSTGAKGVSTTPSGSTAPSGSTGAKGGSHSASVGSAGAGGSQGASGSTAPSGSAGAKGGSHGASASVGSAGANGGSHGASASSSHGAGGSHSASGTPRAGRREAERKRPPQPATPTLIDQLRKPFLVSFLVFVVMAVGLVVVTQTASPAYACGAVDTVQSPAPGELGQVQPDQGNQHVLVGDKVTYPVCPPASGKHINQTGFGPLPPKVYGPNDQAIPNGWVHNLEHGGLVLLYSCDKGTCDAASLAALQAFSSQFPASPVCKIPPGDVGPVVARFEQMPTRFAALLWDRALYLDTLDVQKIDQFFLRYSERLANDGTFVAPPEPQCPAPSKSPAASASPAPSASGG